MTFRPVVPHRELQGEWISSLEPRRLLDIREEHFSPEPIFCSIEPTPTVRSVGLMYKRGRELSHAAKRFIETAQREIPAYVRANAVSYQVAREIDLTGRL